MYHGCSQRCNQIRVFSIGFLSPAPTGVTEQVHIWCPERQPLINIPVALFGTSVIHRPCFGRCHLAHLLHQFGRKGCRHADCLRKHRRRAGSCQPVQALVPPVVGRNPQPWNCRGIISQLTCLLCNGHLLHQCFCFFSIGSIHLDYSFPVPQRYCSTISAQSSTHPTQGRF